MDSCTSPAEHAKIPSPLQQIRYAMQVYSLGILAGGEGRRVNGADKGWMLWQGTNLIEHQLDKFGGSATQVMISANRELERYQLLAADVVSDLRPDFPGPLAGVEALMLRCSVWPLVVVPCDCPELPSDLPQRLLGALAGHDVAVAFDGERQQHLCLALSTPTLIAALTDYLDRGERSVHGWLSTTDVVRVPFDPASGTFANLNTLADGLRQP